MWSPRGAVPKQALDPNEKDRIPSYVLCALLPHISSAFKMSYRDVK